MKSANLALSFVLEILALLAFGYAAFALGPNLPCKITFAVGLPLSLAVIWSLFLAPRARRRMPMPGLLVVKLVIFTASSAALYEVAKPNAAYLLLALIVLNTVFVVIWEQY